MITVSYPLAYRYDFVPTPYYSSTEFDPLKDFVVKVDATKLLSIDPSLNGIKYKYFKVYLDNIGSNKSYCIFHNGYRLNLTKDGTTPYNPGGNSTVGSPYTDKIYNFNLNTTTNFKVWHGAALNVPDTTVAFATNNAPYKLISIDSNNVATDMGMPASGSFFAFTCEKPNADRAVYIMSITKSTGVNSSPTGGLGTYLANYLLLDEESCIYMTPTMMTDTTKPYSNGTFHYTVTGTDSADLKNNDMIYLRYAYQMSPVIEVLSMAGGMMIVANRTGSWIHTPTGQRVDLLGGVMTTTTSGITTTRSGAFYVLAEDRIVNDAPVEGFSLNTNYRACKDIVKNILQRIEPEPVNQINTQILISHMNTTSSYITGTMNLAGIQQQITSLNQIADTSPDEDSAKAARAEAGLLQAIYNMALNSSMNTTPLSNTLTIILMSFGVGILLTWVIAGPKWR